MQKRIAILGGSFNPPGTHHQEIARMLSKWFDELVVVPCGDRNDKPTTSSIAPTHRAHMAYLTFESTAPNVRVDNFDLHGGLFTPMVKLQARYAPLGEVWHIIGTDLVTGGAYGASDIQRYWKQGRELWTSLNFAICLRAGVPLEYHDLPPNRRVFLTGSDGASKKIRRRLADGHSIADLVLPEVETYIRKHELYQPV